MSNSKVVQNLTKSEIERRLGYPINIVERMRVNIDSIEPGEVFQTADGIDWIVLQNGSDFVFAVTKELYGSANRWRKTNDAVGDRMRNFITNDYNHSSARLICDKFKTLMHNHYINPVPHCVSQFALDGRQIYTEVKSPVRLLTFDEACRFRDILEKHRVSQNWWLMNARDENSLEYDTEDIMCAIEHGPSFSIGYAACYKELGIRPCAFFRANEVVSIE